MDVFKELDDLNTNLLKLRNSIYENDIITKATVNQEDTFYKMLKTLIARTKLYLETFNSKSHVIKTIADIDKMQESLDNDDINFYINTFEERLDWYYENERKDEEGNFIAAADVIILWPLRAINERMYRYLFNQTYDRRLDNFFESIDKKDN